MDVLSAILTRRSVREYDPRPLASDVLARLRQALWAAPSACNFQPWHFILVQDAGVRRELGRCANDQHFVGKAPLVVVACGLPHQAHKQMGGRHNSVDVDVAIALDHLTLAATAEGLGTCWIGAFQEEAIKRLLGVPRDVRIIALLPVGYPATADLLTPLDPSDRKPPEEIFSAERYLNR